jgi:hypothetical protein
MSNRAFFTQVNRALDASGAVVTDAEVTFFENRTTTQIQVFADPDLTTERSQPVPCDANGVFPACYIPGSSLVRVLVATGLGAPLPGYPMDDVALPSAGGTASDIAFTPTDDIPETNVQAAIAAAGALGSDQSSVFQRGETPWTTGGTGNAYTITPDPAITAYGDFQKFTILANRTSTGAATLNVNGLGARDIRKISSSATSLDTAANDLTIGSHYDVVFDGDNFTLIRNALGGYGTTYRRTKDGWQYGIDEITLTFGNVDRLTGVVTFEVPYISAPFISAHLPLDGANYTSISDLTRIGQFTNTTSPTSGAIRLYRVYGAPEWGSGAAISGVRVFSFGRWF